MLVTQRNICLGLPMGLGPRSTSSQAGVVRSAMRFHCVVLGPLTLPISEVKGVSVGLLLCFFLLFTFKVSYPMAVNLGLALGESVTWMSLLTCPKGGGESMVKPDGPTGPL